MNRSKSLARLVHWSFAAALLCGVVLGAGCATGEYTYVARISGGQRLEIPLVKGSPKRAKQGDIQIVHAGVLPTGLGAEKKLPLVFAFTDEKGVAPQSVVVEDVTEAKPLLVLEDRAPVMTEKRWTKLTDPLEGDAPEFAWLGQLGDTMRVFRFTIVRGDGTKVVVHQGWFVPGWMKSAMRMALGLPSL